VSYDRNVIGASPRRPFLALLMWIVTAALAVPVALIALVLLLVLAGEHEITPNEWHVLVALAAVGSLAVLALGAEPWFVGGAQEHAGTKDRLKLGRILSVAAAVALLGVCVWLFTLDVA
jgi:uncharacterized membrane protein YbhN (UPF0104 family)